MRDEGAFRRYCVARAAARLGELQVGGVFCAKPQLDGTLLAASGEPLLRQLLGWAVLLNRTRQLIDEILPAALHEPGRLHTRYISERSSHPSTVHWPKTIARRMGREQFAQFEFVCRASKRTLLAPENILLVWCLERTISEGDSALGRLARLGLLGPDGRRGATRFTDSVRTALGNPAFKECRVAVAELASGGERAVDDLVAQVRSRTEVQPMVAPSWARELVKVRTDLRVVPRHLNLSSVDTESLWLGFAMLELVSAIRALWNVRQSRERPAHFLHGSRSLSPLGESRDYVLADHGAVKAAVALIGLAEPGALKYAAYDRLFDAREAGAAVDRWLVLHRCESAIETIRRNHLEIRFVRALPRASITTPLVASVMDWLA